MDDGAHFGTAPGRIGAVQRWWWAFKEVGGFGVGGAEELTEAELMSHDCNDYEPPYSWAIGHGHIDVVRLYMEARVNPTIQKIRGSTGLHIAVERMQEPTLIQLSGEHSADVKATNDDGTTLIHLAAANEHAPVLEYLLQNGANAETIYKNKRTPLIAAARHGKGFTVEMRPVSKSTTTLRFRQQPPMGKRRL